MTVKAKIKYLSVFCNVLNKLGESGRKNILFYFSFYFIPVRTPGFKSRIRPPYPQTVVKATKGATLYSHSR